MSWTTLLPYLKPLLVFLAVYLQSFLVYAFSVLQSPFQVTHLVNRGIPKFQVGLIGMMPGVGYLLNVFYDIPAYCLITRKMALRTVQSTVMAIIGVNFVVQGMVELMPTSLNTFLAVLLMCQRLIHGFFAFLITKITVESCRTWFPDHIKLTVGLECSAYYLGGSLAVLMAGFVYEAYSYQAPYIILGVFGVVLWLYIVVVMPRDSEPVYLKEKVHTTIVVAPWTGDEKKDEKKTVDEAGLSSSAHQAIDDSASDLPISWYITLPLIVLTLTEVLEGYSAVITTPYLKDEFDLPVSKGSSYVFAQYIGLMVGAVCSGSFLQTGWLSSSKVMAVGSLLCAVGVLLVFPGNSFPTLYNIVPKSAYCGIFMQGFGCQAIAVATLPAIEEVHTILGKRRYTQRHKFLASTLWACGWMFAVYGGQLIAPLVMEHMTYTSGGWMLAAFSGVAILLSIIQDLVLGKTSQRIPVPPTNRSESEI